MSMVVPGGQQPPGLHVPQRGAFATSEVLPLVQQASGQLRRARDEWRAARDAASNAKALAKKTRADLIVTLRTWGNDVTGEPIKTSAERNEWADADADVQQRELEADLAQTVAMTAGAALKQAEEEFGMLRSALGIERDEMAAERGGPSFSP